MANGVAVDEAGNGRKLKWRVERLEEWRKEIDDLKPELMAHEIHQLNNKMDRLTGVVIKVGISIVGSAVVFAFTVFALIGGPQ